MVITLLSILIYEPVDDLVKLFEAEFQVKAWIRNAGIL
jgi:hypothetical protein